MEGSFPLQPGEGKGERLPGLKDFSYRHVPSGASPARRGESGGRMPIPSEGEKKGGWSNHYKEKFFPTCSTRVVGGGVRLGGGFLEISAARGGSGEGRPARSRSRKKKGENPLLKIPDGWKKREKRKKKGGSRSQDPKVVPRTHSPQDRVSGRHPDRERGNRGRRSASLVQA